MSQFHLGIDIAKDTFTVALLHTDHTYRGQFRNDAAGFDKLRRWLQNRAERVQIHACMEATGSYWEALALFLVEHDYQVSVVNPKRIKHHAEATMRRNKTDRQDALTIADYCAKQAPAPWEPPSAAYRELKAMVRHVQALKDDRQRERNRRASGSNSPEVLTAIDAHLAFLDQQITALEQRIHDHIDDDPDLKADKALLTSIPGIGDTAAATFLSEVPDVSRFAQASQVAAYAGLTPGDHLSGSSIQRPGRLVKWGNAHLRTVFYMPALSAHRWNPIIANLKERLERRDKSKMTIVVATMRKLVHLCYGVLKTRKPFDPEHAVKAQTA